jgi:hypothetical protein
VTRKLASPKLDRSSISETRRPPDDRCSGIRVHKGHPAESLAGTGERTQESTIPRKRPRKGVGRHGPRCRTGQPARLHNERCLHLERRTPQDFTRTRRPKERTTRPSPGGIEIAPQARCEEPDHLTEVETQGSNAHIHVETHACESGFDPRLKALKSNGSNASTRGRDPEPQGPGNRPTMRRSLDL